MKAIMSSKFKTIIQSSEGRSAISKIITNENKKSENVIVKGKKYKISLVQKPLND